MPVPAHADRSLPPLATRPPQRGARTPRAQLPALLAVLLAALAGCGGGGGGADLRAPDVSALPPGGLFAAVPALQLVADEAATIHLTTNGEAPAPDGPHTLSGRSPMPVFLAEGTTQLRFCAEDASGNLSPEQSEVYTVDLQDPQVQIAVGDAPPLLGSVAVDWHCAEDCEFQVELGGDGSRGSGSVVAGGSAAGGAPQVLSFTGLQLGGLGTRTLWVHATDRAGRRSATSRPLQLRPFALLPVGEGPRQVALLPGDRKAYVSCAGADAVAVVDIDPASASFHSLLATVPVGSSPGGLAVAVDGSRVYVTEAEGASAIATGTDALIASVSAPGGTAARGIAVTPDGSRAYFAAPGGVAVLDVDPSSLGYHQLAGLLARPQLQRARFAVYGDGSAMLVDWADAAARRVELVGIDPLQASYHQLLATLIGPVGGDGAGWCRSADDRFAYGLGAQGLCRIDLQQQRVDASAAIAAGAVALVPGLPLLVAAAPGTLTLCSSADLQPLVTVAAPWARTAPGSVAVTADGTRVYVACGDAPGEDRLAVLQLRE